MMDWIRNHVWKASAVDEATTLLIRRARDKFGMDVVNRFNIAICGETCAGKSSFINAYRKVKDTDPNAARAGLTETTEEAKKFSTESHLDFWDMPGAGTPGHPVETYYEDNMLYAFDAVLVFFEGQIESVVHVVEQCKENGIECALVRTKCDLEDEEYLLAVREMLNDLTIALGVEGFMISSRDVNRYDYRGLQQFVAECAKKGPRFGHR